MKYRGSFYRITIAILLTLPVSIFCQAQSDDNPLGKPHPSDEKTEKPHPDNCTLSFGGSGTWRPFGNSAETFNFGGGIQAAGGIHFPHFYVGKWPAFLIGTYIYDRLGIPNDVLTNSQNINAIPKGTTDAEGRFSAITLDPMLRFTFKHKPMGSVYALGGFGWLRRDINFSQVNLGNLANPNNSTLANAVSSSGVYDFGSGLNFAPNHFHGFLFFIEGRYYHGTAINNTTILVPFTVGLRWEAH